LDPPFLVNVFPLSPTTVNVTAGPKTVNIQVIVQDNGSGFESGSVWLLDQETNAAITTSTFSLNTPRGGAPIAFNVTLTIPQFVAAEGYIFQFVLRDAASNQAFPVDFDGAKYFKIQVVNTVVDVKPPELLNFTVSKRTVNPLTGVLTVRYRVVASDDLSGLRGGEGGSSVLINSAGSNFFSFQNLDVAPPKARQQVIEGTFTFSENFDWNAIYSLEVTLLDVALNSVKFKSRDLIDRGFPGFLPTTL
jgi:hypothetical protein